MFDSLFCLILVVLLFCVAVQVMKAAVIVAVAKPRLALKVAKRAKDWLQAQPTSDGPKSGATAT